MEEKAKAYDEVLKKVKDLISRCKNDTDRRTMIYRVEDIESILPELAESEDEKIRKEIINYFQCQSEEEPTRKEIHDKWIAWLENIPYTIDHEKREGFHLGYKACLEKQGEKKSQRTISAEAKEALFDYENANIKQKDFAPNDEQKPAEQQMYWTEEEIKPIISDYLCGMEHYGGMIGRLCHLKPKQKQTEWGENDKAFLDDILCKLEHDLILNKDEKDWLKSLRPQPEQSLDEDTQQWIDTIIKDYEDLYNTDKDHSATIQAKISILKSLRPQNRWKPSDEQMDLLQAIINEPNNAASESCQIVLKDILEQLKKLKKEQT